MENEYEDWDEYDFMEHIEKLQHNEFLRTPEGKWQNQKDAKQAGKYFLYIIIALIVLFILIRLNACHSYENYGEPLRRD